MASDSDVSLPTLSDLDRRVSTSTASNHLPRPPSNRSLSPTHTVPTRNAKLKIGSLAEPSTKVGGVRATVDRGKVGGRAAKKRKTDAGGGNGEKKLFKRDKAGKFSYQGGRKRVKKGKGEVKQEEGDDGEVIDVTLLEDPKKSRFFGSLTLLDYTNDPLNGHRIAEETLKTVKVGDIVQILQPREYAVIEKISVPREKLHRPPTYVPAKVARPNPMEPELKATRRAFIKTSYFYSESAFTALEGDPYSAFKQQARVMGPNELVKTDHLDWKPADTIQADASESVIYCFDDYYPARSPHALTPGRHPLSLFTPDELDFLSPSEHALPALEPSSPHPPTKLDVHLPPFFFGVGSGQKGEEGRSESSALLDGGRDGRQGTPFARVGFCFEPSEIKNEATEDEEDAQERRRKRKGRKRQMTVFPLTFNAHSTPRTPYNPRHVQIFSPHCERWFNVDELVKGHHYRRKDEFEKMTCNGMGEQGDQKGKAAALPDIDLTDDIPLHSPSRTPSPSHSASSSSSASSTSSNDSFASFARSLGVFNDESLLLDRLTSLWSSTIRRGGANGLTGNAYLVTSAGELLALLSHTASSTSDPSQARAQHVLSSSQRTNALAEARVLLSAAKKWERGVKDRVEGKGEGRGLGREWRETGESPSGAGGGGGGAWTGPVTGKEM
ncbi:hypothetical protein JCM11251_005271 [Rhodosporidiobolus azoricus]